MGSFPPPARFAAPLLVLVFGLATTWLNYRWNLADDLARGQAELRAAADATGTRLVRLGEQLRSAIGIAALQADLRASVEAPNLALAAFVDANGWVLAGSSSELSGHAARQTLLRAAANLIGRSSESNVLHSEDAAQLYAAYPVVDSDSWVLLVYDRSATMQKARAAAWRSLEWSALATGALCAALWAVLHFGFAKRIARLAQAVRGFGAGERVPIMAMPGGDEVAELSRAFAAMANSVTVHEQQRARMEKQVLEAGERERRRLGHELHDGLGQHLTAAALAADALAESLSAANREEATRATEMARHIRAAIKETRELSHGLAPVGIEQGGLVNALAEMAATIAVPGKLRVVFECEPSDLTCFGEPASHLFRIAQEAVTNALKHAAPGEIRLGLRRQANRLVLEVEDDGEGMPETLPPDAGMGLRVMQHRAQLLGGTFALAAAPAGGTLMRCDVPFES
ncbi:MAG: sensor histidine kinase [Verrucomicrobia bacterium]|nr:sensor histidine kinase [Verrucomicrobiota bacterium]